MPSHTSTSTRRLIFLLTFLLLLIVLFYHKLPSKSPTTIPSTSPSIIHSPIDGRWRAVRASLGLPPLSDAILPSSPPPPALRVISRFDLRKRKKSSSKPTDEPNQLFFSSDALDEPKVSLEGLADSFRAIALIEKEVAGQKARDRISGQRSNKRPSSWSVRKTKRV